MRRNLAIVAALLISIAPALAQVFEPPQQQPQGPRQLTPVRPELREARKAMRRACMEDVRTLCSQSEGPQSGSPQRGGGTIMMCLRSHSDQVSQGCKDATRHLREVRRGA